MVWKCDSGASDNKSDNNSLREYCATTTSASRSQNIKLNPIANDSRPAKVERKLTRKVEIAPNLIYGPGMADWRRDANTFGGRNSHWSCRWQNVKLARVQPKVVQSVLLAARLASDTMQNSGAEKAAKTRSYESATRWLIYMR